jgi:hypothetical protein
MRIMPQMPQESSRRRSYGVQPLSYKHAFAALRNKRAEIAGKFATLHKEIGRQQKDLA